jgi:RNA recognition motif-containing protein
MARNSYSQSKRQREADKARRKKEKAARRAERREQGPAEPEIISAEEMTGDLPTAGEALQAMEQRARAPRSAAGVPCRLFVGSLSWDTTTETLRSVFSQFGQVTDAAVLTDRTTGQSRGFGFVTFESRKDAARAIEQLNGSEIDGREIVVNIATER